MVRRGDGSDNDLLRHMPRCRSYLILSREITKYCDGYDDNDPLFSEFAWNWTGTVSLFARYCTEQLVHCDDADAVNAVAFAADAAADDDDDDDKSTFGWKQANSLYLLLTCNYWPYRFR